MEHRIMKDIERQVEHLSQAEVLDIAGRLIEIAKAKRSIDWSRYSGILDPQLDPLQYQHAVRDEWER